MKRVLPHQIEEYKHRIGDKVFILNKINAEIIYFLEKNNYLDKVFSGIIDYQNILFQALASSDHRIRVRYGKTLTRELWELELGLGAYPFSDVLSTFEFAGKFYRGYRDHVLHQLRVYLLGLYLYWGCKKIRNNIDNFFKTDDFLLIWKISALSHDHGYIFENDDAERDQWVYNNVIPALHNFASFPLSTLSDSIRRSKFFSYESNGEKNLHGIIRENPISYQDEFRLQDILEIMPMRVTTLSDIFQFRGNDLFELLKNVAIGTGLSNKSVNGIKQYYNFVAKYGVQGSRDPYYDHGITSALLLLYQAMYHQYYVEKINKAPAKKLRQCGLEAPQIKFLRGVCRLFKKNYSNVVEAAGAVALHNISNLKWNKSEYDLKISEKDYDIKIKNFNISSRKFPIAHLLALVDIIQDWDRPSFSVPNIDNLNEYQTDQDLSITFNENKLFFCFLNKEMLPYDPLKKLASNLTTIIKPNEINTLIDETKWEGLNVCYLTEQAKEIEQATVSDERESLSEILKKMIKYGQKRNNFEYTLFLDTRRESHFYRLALDFAAISNSGNGYFVVGISEIDFELYGIDQRSYIEELSLLQMKVNLFFNSPIDFLYETKKIAVYIDGRKKYKNFVIFKINKSPILLLTTKNGYDEKNRKKYFNKFSIPLRKDNQSKIATKSDIKNLVKDCVKNHNDGNLWSLIDQKGIIPLPKEIYYGNIPKPLPGYLPEPDFLKLIGRNKDIEGIISKVESPKKFSLTIDGVGGSGKTAIAYEIAYSIKNHLYNSEFQSSISISDYNGVIWVSAKTCELTEEGIVTKFSTPVTLDILLDNIADVIELPDLKRLEFYEKKSDVIQLLEGDENFKLFIVIDNLETISEIHQKEIVSFLEDELPPPSKVIYTTRTSYHDGVSMRIRELKSYDAEELCRELFMEFDKYHLSNNKRLINEICLKTGRIPIGIKWVVSRIASGIDSTENIGDIVKEKDLLKFCFEESFYKLNTEEKHILVAVAYCDFNLKEKDVAYLTGLPTETIANSIEKLEAFSLLKRQSGKIHILPLTRQYAKFTLISDSSFKKIRGDLDLKVNHLYRLDSKDDNGASTERKIALQLYKESEKDANNGDFIAAKNKLINALSMSNEAYLLKALAEICERLDENADSLKYYKLYLDINPKDLELLKKIALHYKSDKNLKEAHHYLKIATEHFPNAKDLYHYKGMVEKGLYFENRINQNVAMNYVFQAINSFKKSIRKPGEIGYNTHFNAINYTQLSICYLISDKKEEARAACIYGLQEEPNNFRLNKIKSDKNFEFSWPVVEIF